MFSHGWPLRADAWDAQMLFFGERGWRVVAYDRRGHGHSDQTWQGNDQIVPIGVAALLSEKLVPNAMLKIYPSCLHGLAQTHAADLDTDLLAFIESSLPTPGAAAPPRRRTDAARHGSEVCAAGSPQPSRRSRPRNRMTD